MKIFEKYAVNLSNYGSKYREDIMIGIGKIFRNRTAEIITMNEFGAEEASFHRIAEPEGGFIRFELPFVKTVTYTCPYDFVEKTGKCRPTWLFWTCKPGGKRRYKKRFAWKPLDPALLKDQEFRVGDMMASS